MQTLHRRLPLSEQHLDTFIRNDLRLQPLHLVMTAIGKLEVVRCNHISEHHLQLGDSEETSWAAPIIRYTSEIYKEPQIRTKQAFRVQTRYSPGLEWP